LGCGTVFLIVVVIGAITVIFNRNPPAPVQKAPIVAATPQRVAAVGYQAIASMFDDAANNLDNPTFYKDRVATRWMQIRRHDGCK
jgi:hypothetical protein